MAHQCNFNISCKDVKIKYKTPPKEERQSMCPEGSRGPLPLSCLPTKEEKLEEIKTPKENYDLLRTPRSIFVPQPEEPKKSPVICPCMLPFPEYEPPPEILPIRHETATIIPENPLYCPAFYKHPCPAAAGTGICPAHGSPRVGDICPSSTQEILNDGKLTSKDVIEKDKNVGRFISCKEKEDTMIKPDLTTKDKNKKSDLKVPDKLKAKYEHHIHTCNLPARPDHPGWFQGYRCEWPSSKHFSYRTTQMDYGWFPPNIYTIPALYAPRLCEFSSFYGNFEKNINCSLNL